MDSRREFIKKATMLSGAAGLFHALPASIQQALAIDPEKGSTYLDAEHVVILMQENRSFDHCYGSLQGVRGFNDPRAIRQANGNSVWLQTNASGETYAPFRLNIKETKSTWLGSLPHSWGDQVDARNGGKYDQWLIAKASGHEGFENTPLTLGFYNREDIPFYYSLADAFTVCDQNFCSSLTGTTPNRLYLWTGTIRDEQDANAQANVSNGDTDYEKEKHWKTFPERLEENGISWKIYQNEISLESGLTGDEDSWLSNFTDNPIEWFKQYNVRFSQSYGSYLEKMETVLPAEIADLENRLKSLDEKSKEAEDLQRVFKSKQSLLSKVKDRERWSKENFEKLSSFEKNLHRKAFATNNKDPHYRDLTTLRYKDGETEREMSIPKGDVLHQFREDVNNGTLPTVSWVVGSANFSDHPGSPWYGAWYVSEVLDILTKKPEIWKKTIFILCYDENDGYFDHVPPFVPPHPDKKDTGLVSRNIDVAMEFVTWEQDIKRTKEKYARESPIGLGYRVPLVIASPWSRGGAVCSQVFDHTSILRFLEKFLTNKTGKKVTETNISAWRRTVCGDLTSVFKPYNGEKLKAPIVVQKEPFYESIHKAQYKKDPAGYKQLTSNEIYLVNQNAMNSPVMPQQEKGNRLSCPLPYQLYADGQLNPGKKIFEIKMSAANDIFDESAAGSPFNVYAYEAAGLKIRNYAVTAGDELIDQLSVADFKNNNYHFQLNGPNGFLREFRGTEKDPALDVTVDYERKKTNNKKLSGNIMLKLSNADPNNSCVVEIIDNAYKKGKLTRKLEQKGSAKSTMTIVLDLQDSFSWYDFTIRIAGNSLFSKRYAGHVETGEMSRTDPAMGNG